MLILEEIKTMRKELKEIFIHGCNEKIEKKEIMLVYLSMLFLRIKTIILSF
jgi:hypothetical protein